MKEEWRDVVGFPGYRVSSLGRVTGKIVTVLTPRNSPQGYPTVWLSVGGAVTAKKVASLVCEAFHGPRPLGMQCAHNDGDRSNSREDNLRWATPRENAADRTVHGTLLQHEGHYRAVLTLRAIRWVRRKRDAALSRARKRGCKRLPPGFWAPVEERLGVSRKQLQKVMRGAAWRGIP